MYAGWTPNQPSPALPASTAHERLKQSVPHVYFAAPPLFGERVQRSQLDAVRLPTRERFRRDLRSSGESASRAVFRVGTLAIVSKRPAKGRKMLNATPEKLLGLSGNKNPRLLRHKIGPGACRSQCRDGWKKSQWVFTSPYFYQARDLKIERTRSALIIWEREISSPKFTMVPGHQLQNAPAGAGFRSKELMKYNSRRRIRIAAVEEDLNICDSLHGPENIDRHKCGTH
jgi:hypothetical protein